jgi:hypothetical protein
MYYKKTFSDENTQSSFISEQPTDVTANQYKGRQNYWIGQNEETKTCLIDV